MNEGKGSHEADPTTGLCLLQRVVVATPLEGLRAKPATVRGAAVITGPQLYFATVAPQERKLPVVVEAGRIVVLCLQSTTPPDPDSPPCSLKGSPCAQLRTLPGANTEAFVT